LRAGAPVGTFLLDRQHAPRREHTRGAPEQDFSIVSRLETENSLIPVGIMREANVFDLEIGLPGFPFPRPGQMRLVELLSQLGNFDLVGIRKNICRKHGTLASLSPSQGSAPRKALQFGTKIQRLVFSQALAQAKIAFRTQKYRKTEMKS
jgi:hypothetical protein